MAASFLRGAGGEAPPRGAAWPEPPAPAPANPRATGAHSPQLRVRYPSEFKAFAILVLAMSIAWLLNFALVVMPTARKPTKGLCRYNNEQLRHNTEMLFCYFACFAIARVAVFLPRFAEPAAEASLGIRGACWTYAVHMALQGPLYIFSIGSVLFWVQLLQSPSCQARYPDLFRTLKLYAASSCLLSLLCLLFAGWQRRLLASAIQSRERDERRAPPGTLDRMPVIGYDPVIFGDEEGKRFPSECPICLAAWEPEEIIKITPCGHAFHSECLGTWFENNRTCALCRQDVTKCPEAAPTATAREAPGQQQPSGSSNPDLEPGLHEV